MHRGALPEPELLELAAAEGLIDGIIHSWVDSFAGTSAASKVSRDLHVGAVNFSARKPDNGSAYFERQPTDQA